MGVFLFSILFEMHYKCHYGDSVYVLGNIPELGEWSIQKGLQLKWKENDLWNARLDLKIDNGTFIQYKYLIASEEGVIKRWESGPNRILSLKNINKLKFSLSDVWGYRKVSIRLNKPEYNENPFYISGNTPDLGEFKTLKKMNFFTKKSFLLGEESYWEKTTLIPNDFPVDIVYNFYELDQQQNCILINELNYSVNIFEDLKYMSFEKLWSPQTLSNKRPLPNQMTISPFRLKRNTHINAQIKIMKNKPERVEIKYGAFQVTNEIKRLSSFVKEINKEMIIGNNCLNSSDLAFLEKEIDAVVVFKNSEALINDVNQIYEGSVSKISNNPNVSNFTIFANQINRDDPSNLLAWAQCLHTLTRTSRKIFICWSDCKEEMFEILLHYLHHFKHFSFKAAAKFLNLKSDFKF